jgi:hypothetical protein
VKTLAHYTALAVFLQDNSGPGIPQGSFIYEENHLGADAAEKFVLRLPLKPLLSLIHYPVVDKLTLSLYCHSEGVTRSKNLDPLRRSG